MSAVPTLLQIEASPRGQRSRSRAWTSRLLAAWREAHPRGRVVTRDLRITTVPHVDEPWIIADATPAAQRTPGMRARLAQSDAMTRELLEADDLLIGLPMYNWGVPSAFKAWIDAVCREGLTFAYTPGAVGGLYTPLIKARRAFVVVACGAGGYEPGGALWSLNQLEPFVRTVLGVLGVREVHLGYVAGEGQSDSQRDAMFEGLRRAIAPDGARQDEAVAGAASVMSG